MNAMQTDFLVVGSGIAGLTYALKVANRFPDKQVLVMTKAAADETNTKYAQGGVAVVNDLEKDSFEKHIEDTYSRRWPLQYTGGGDSGKRRP